MMMPAPLENSDRRLRAVVAHAPDALGVLRLAFEGAPHGVVVSGEDGTILFANSLASGIFSYAPGELFGHPLSRLLPGQMPLTHDDQWADFWKNPQTRSIIAGRTVAGIRKDGAMVPLEIGLNLLADGAASYVVASLIDITERLNLEARLAAATNANLGFQRLVADVAAGFVSIDQEKVDGAIVDTLRQIGEALQLDRATLWQRGRGDSLASPTHHWKNPPDPL